MWKVLFILLLAHCLHAQIVGMKMISIWTHADSVEINETPVFSNNLNEEKVYEFRLSGGAVSFSDDLNSKRIRQSIKMAIDYGNEPSMRGDFDHRWRFFIDNEGEVNSTDDLQFYFEETVRTNEESKSYTIDYYSLTASEMRDKFKTSQKRINKYIKDQADDVKLVFLDEERGIYFLSFQLQGKPLVQPSPQMKPAKDYFALPQMGKLEPQVKEIQAPFTYDVKYTNTFGLEHVMEGQLQSDHFRLKIQTKKYTDPNTDEIKFLQYNLFCRIIPYKYRGDVLEVELLMRAEKAIFDIRGKNEGVFSNDFSKKMRFDKNDVVEVRLPEDWPKPLQIQRVPGTPQKPDSEYYLGFPILGQSLIIRPVRIE